MKALILDGGRRDGDVSVVGREIEGALGERGWSSETLALRDLDIASCSGCYRCWVATPGVCVTDDPARDVARLMAGSDLVVFLTPVVFGGYSFELKKALDRSIGNILPFFAAVAGETHHAPRYARAPSLVAVGVRADSSPEAREVFSTIVKRNALNFHAPATAVATVDVDDGPGTARQVIDGLLHDVSREAVAGGVAPTVDRRLLAPTPWVGGVPRVPEKVVLLVGSPRPARSTSASLGTYLLSRLEDQGIQTETVNLRRFLERKQGSSSMSAVVGRADLVVVSSPLYVDSLPAHVIRCLELLAGSGGGVRRLTALVNSGFPESSQCHPALAVYRQFAIEAGFHWSGGLALGAGATIDGRPLLDAAPVGPKASAALDLAGAALACGDDIPDEAMALMEEPVFDPEVYRAAGDRGFERQGEKHGATDRLRDRPYS